MSEHQGFSIRGQGNGGPVKLDFQIIGYEHPEATDVDDGNWLNAHLYASIPGFKGSFGLTLRTDELEGLRKDLEKINKGKSRSLEFEPMEPFVKLKCQADKLGHLDWVSRIQYPLGDGSTLEFEFQSDLSYLPVVLEDLEKVLKTYPMKGNKLFKFFRKRL